MNLPVYIATRYFLSKRKRGGFNAVNIISVISLLGYTIGAAALFIVLSVFNGFEGLFVKMYSNFDADLRVVPAMGKTMQIHGFPLNKLNGLNQITDKVWVWEENALIRYNRKQTIATVKAVGDNYSQINPLDSNLLRGVLLLKSGDTSFAWVGQGIGYQLGVDPDDQFNRLGIFLPRKGKIDMLNPEGAFANGYLFASAIFGVQEEVDNKYILIPLSYMQQLLEDSASASALEIKLENGSNLDKEKRNLQALLGSQYLVKTRFEQRESFFKVMQSEKTISYFILVFILLIAAFNTIGSLYMLVMEKQRDFFVFATMGLMPASGSLIILIQSLWIAISGGLAGIGLGALVCLGQQTFGWIALETANNITLSAYPVSMKFTDALLVFVTLLGLGILTALYPAKKASEFIAHGK